MLAPKNKLPSCTVLLKQVNCFSEHKVKRTFKIHLKSDVRPCVTFPNSDTELPKDILFRTLMLLFGNCIHRGLGPSAINSVLLIDKD